MNLISDWTDLDAHVGDILLKWIYTDAVQQEDLTLELMKAASTFQLIELVEKSETYLIGKVDLKDCVRLYTAAEELNTERLRDHCSSLISAHWVKE